MVDLSVGVRVIRNWVVTQVAEDSDLDRFGPSDRRNTLRPVSLMYCIEYEMYGSCPLGDPCLSLYTLEGQGYKENSLFGTI